MVGGGRQVATRPESAAILTGGDRRPATGSRG